MAGKTCKAGRFAGITHLEIYRFLEGSEFFVGQHYKKGLQEHDGFAQAGIKVIVRSVHGLPIHGGLWGSAGADILGGLAKVFANIDNHLFEGADFVEKLRALGEEHAAQQLAHFCGALLARALEIRGV
jgi:hypothetical protein